MNLIKPHKLKKYSFFFSIPLIVVAMNVILFEDRIWKEEKIWFYSIPIMLVNTMSFWFIHLAYDNWLKKKYPELNQSRQRIFLKAIWVIVLIIIGMAFIFFVYNRFHILGYHLKYADLPKAFFLGLAINLVFESLYEADYILSKYKEGKTEKETLKQLAVAQEFDSLKNQVNPHFLFNCFNTLSSLISVDKEKAEVFLNELSKVYRYLLQNNEQGVSTLENEIKFIKSYYKLLQTRHGEAVQLNLNIDKRYDAYLLPSLSLQLLVENVVKHNVLSKNKPLVIDIFTTAGNKLIINNNLQRRTVKAPSNRVGLDNIKAKYTLLKQPGLQVMEDEKNFTVVLPLIWNNTTTNKLPMLEDKNRNTS